ncbi:Bleomycin resistance protein [Chryseobacterium sp. Leaf404]|uniref:bleomycin resistance protein n=1 Tax=unclassified Chryseobacterium TaxID=2593645 RepID=UPI0006FF1FE5|nr:MULTISPECIES: VOC family protein [unclassified Chryseobacterium]KQT17972.1 Bleomycin resistance protein [Chryseobacterium sp. Leaf404]
MLTQIHPKLPMRNKAETKKYYIEKLGFEQLGSDDFPDYLMLKKDEIEIHFFLFTDLNPKENYGMVYIRVSGIDAFYHSLVDERVEIHPNGSLQTKSWGQKEFSLLDPDSNLLTFGESF